MHLLVASLLPLLLGPLLAGWLVRWHHTARALDAFILVSVAGLVLLHILPQAFADAGAIAVLAALVGAIIPMVGGKLFSTKPGTVRTVTLAVALVGLAMHAIMDGLALAPQCAHGHGHEHAHDSALGFAVVLHRIPVGLAIWWLVRPRLGLRIAILSILCISVSSVVGYFAADHLFEWMHGPALGAFQAMVAGSLLHVAVGHSATAQKPEIAQPARWQVPSAIGGVIGIGAVMILASAHPLKPVAEFHLEMGTTFLTLARESALALLLAYGLAAILYIFLPGTLGARLRGGSALSQAARGVGAGIAVTTCSCGVTHRYADLVRGGAPPAAAIAFLLAAPELSLAAVFLSFRLLGAEMTLARVVAAAGLALLAGLLIGSRIVNKRSLVPEEPAEKTAPWSSRIREGIRFGFVRVVDFTLPWFVVGLLVAALLEPLLDPARIAQLPAGLDVPLLTLLGLPLYVCASGSTPMAAVLIHKGISPGAAIAFLLTGPATNVTTFGVLARLHGRKTAIAFGLIVALGAMLVGFVANLVLPAEGLVPLHELASSPPGLVDTLALVALAVLLLLSLLRQGAHGFVGRVVKLHDHASPHPHDHVCSAGHGHAPTALVPDVAASQRL